jgi:phage I-like protein
MNNIVRNRNTATPIPTEGVGFKLPADGWLMLAPYGEFPGVLERRVGEQLVQEECVQVINRAIAETLVAGFQPDLLTDYEHDEENTIAAGWVQELQARDNGLYGRMRWSTKGKADVEGGNYRYFSPVFATRTLGPGREEPVRLIGNTLTNRPNFRKAIQAISNRETPTKEKSMNPKLLALLGLTAGADAAAIESAVATITNKLALIPTLEQELTVVKNREQTLLAAQAEADLLTFKDVIAADSVADVKEQLIKNREPTLKLLKGLKVAPAALPPSPQHVKNKVTAPVGGDAGDVRSIRNKAVADYRAAHKCDFESAWNAVRTAQPKLFED